MIKSILNNNTTNIDGDNNNFTVKQQITQQERVSVQIYIIQKSKSSVGSIS